MEIRALNKNEQPPMDLLLLADPSRSLIDEYLQRGTCYVAEIDGAIVGEYVLLPTRPGTVEIVNVAVREPFHNQGIGKRLVLHAIEEAKKQGYKKVEIGTSTTGTVQIELYKKCGFRITGIDEGFFLRHYEEAIFENGLQVKDMVRMELDLS
ncbi:MAG: GNAT family N-acetyltransferase [Bacillus sp. (in: firmicutes)]